VVHRARPLPRGPAAPAPQVRRAQRADGYSRRCRPWWGPPVSAPIAPYSSPSPPRRAILLSLPSTTPSPPPRPSARPSPRRSEPLSLLFPSPSSSLVPAVMAPARLGEDGPGADGPRPRPLPRPRRARPQRGRGAPGLARPRPSPRGVPTPARRGAALAPDMARPSPSLRPPLPESPPGAARPARCRGIRGPARCAVRRRAAPARRVVPALALRSRGPCPKLAWPPAQPGARGAAPVRGRGTA
jgi:hypothetical protein